MFSYSYLLQFSVNNYMKQHQKDIADLYRTVKRIPIPEADNPMMPKVSNVIDYMGGK